MYIHILPFLSTNISGVSFLLNEECLIAKITEKLRNKVVAIFFLQYGLIDAKQYDIIHISGSITARISIDNGIYYYRFYPWSNVPIYVDTLPCSK
jgi:hypothetical protein